MARNRKRAKERRTRRPPGSPLAQQPGVATARQQRDDSAPDPIAHAAPDVELAEAQLALGRPELTGDETAEELDQDGQGQEEFEEAEEAERVVQDDTVLASLGAGTPRVERGSGSGLAVSEQEVPAPRSVPGNRLVNFILGSWRELQRVQWPDRRQVVQATSVVIGFVIVAGVYLGVADALAAKIVNFILK